MPPEKTVNDVRLNYTVYYYTINRVKNKYAKFLILIIFCNLIVQNNRKICYEYDLAFS